ncbi:UNVERIFIED_CONTAM: hypothetical protein GTU68_035614 [Idotea baltica]|nr:hypothetical protein [Idotea baltica]
MLNIIFYGTPDFAKICLEELHNLDFVNISYVITQPDKKAGRGQKLKASPVKEFALKNNLEVLQPVKPTKEADELIEKFNKKAPIDIAVVVAYGHILPLKLLNYPKSDSINVHASLLPRWRGAAPIQRAIIAGDTESGSCLMKMEKGLDTGPVYAMGKVAIEKNHNAEDLHDNLAKISSKLLRDNLEDIANGKLKAIAQNNENVTYAHKITNEETQIDWNDKGINIINKIRGFSPFPGAYCKLNNKRLKIFKAIILETGTYKITGLAKEFAPDKLVFYCKDSAIEILELQIEGKKRMPVDIFLKGFNF